jgi:hypothetical protein
LPQLLFSGGGITKLAIGHGQRVAHRRRRRIDLQGGFELFARSVGVTARQRRTAEAGARGHRCRLYGNRAREQRLRPAGVATIHVQRAQPHERRDVVRAQCQRALELGDGAVAFVAETQRMAEVVRPAAILRSEDPGVDQERFGLFVELGGDQELADLAECDRLLPLGRGALTQRVQ